MIRRPPRSTQSRSSAASDVYKRQVSGLWVFSYRKTLTPKINWPSKVRLRSTLASFGSRASTSGLARQMSVSYTHLRAHETRHDLVCRLLLEKKKKTNST